MPRGIEKGDAEEFSFRFDARCCGGEPQCYRCQLVRIITGSEYVYEAIATALMNLGVGRPKSTAGERAGLRARIQLTYKLGDEPDAFWRSPSVGLQAHCACRRISEQFFEHPEHEVYGLLYRLQGEIATSTQFFMTDSAAHYLRGVVYFYAAPNPDSLKPVEDFMAAEVVRLIESLEWKEPV